MRVHRHLPILAQTCPVPLTVAQKGLNFPLQSVSQAHLNTKSWGRESGRTIWSDGTASSLARTVLQINKCNSYLLCMSTNGV